MNILIKKLSPQKHSDAEKNTLSFFLAFKLRASLFLCLSAFFILSLQTANADEVPLPDLDPKFVTIKEANPTRDAGYVVGDTLDRTIVINIKKPYVLIKETLPIVGYEHRWKGQISGIELVNITTTETEHNNTVTHTLNLRYQVFTTSKTVTHASLKAEKLRVRNTQNKEILQLRVPFFDFRVSPLSLFGQIKLNEDMSPFIGPFQLDATQNKLFLKLLVGLLSLSLLGLLYIFGVYTWLPKMGGAFAKAYRDIRKMPDTAEGLQKSVARIHESLNTTSGSSLFSSNLAEFLQIKPAFAPVKQEIEQFFDLSRQLFFEENAATNSSNNALNIHSKAWLQKFCRHLRDCERGLLPDTSTKASQ